MKTIKSTDRYVVEQASNGLFEICRKPVARNDLVRIPGQFTQKELDSILAKVDEMHRRPTWAEWQMIINKGKEENAT